MHKHKACHPKGTIHNKIKMKMILPLAMRTRLLEIVANEGKHVRM